MINFNIRGFCFVVEDKPKYPIPIFILIIILAILLERMIKHAGRQVVNFSSSDPITHRIIFQSRRKDSGDGKLHLRLDVRRSFIRRTSTDRDRIFGLMARLCRSIFTFQLSIEPRIEREKPCSVFRRRNPSRDPSHSLCVYTLPSLSLALSLWTKLIDPENALAKVSNIVAEGRATIRLS